MFNVSIVNNSGQRITGSLDVTASASEYYACCVYLLVDLLNGAKEFNQMVRSSNIENAQPIGTTFASQTAIAMFTTTLHKHSSFDPDIVFNNKNINNRIFIKIASLLKLPINDTSPNIYFLDLVSQMKIEGIKSITFSDDFTTAQKNLYICNFPDDLIPEEYLCLLTNQVMDTPCFDKRNPTNLFDKDKIEKQIKEKGKNPYTNEPLTVDGIDVNVDLQDKIYNFMAKVILIPKLFPDTYNDIYQRFKIQIQSQLPSEEFKKILEDEIQKNKNIKKDQVSTTILIKQEQSLNPITLYKEAIEKYNQKDYKNSLAKLEQGLEIFKNKTEKDNSEQCFKCYSTIISCHRELKNYDKAISYAEEALINFSGKLDVSSVGKKYKECLKLRGDKPNAVYEKGVASYKAQQFSLAEHQLLFAIENYDPNTQKAEIAYCHSTLASCYRELKQYETAVGHCEKALKLRKEFLKSDDKLILDTQNKLEGLNKLIITGNKSAFQSNSQKQ